MQGDDPSCPSQNHVTTYTYKVLVAERRPATGLLVGRFCRASSFSSSRARNCPDQRQLLEQLIEKSEQQCGASTMASELREVERLERTGASERRSHRLSCSGACARVFPSLPSCELQDFEAEGGGACKVAEAAFGVPEEWDWQQEVHQVRAGAAESDHWLCFGFGVFFVCGWFGLV